MRCQFKTSRSTHTPPGQRTSFAQSVRPNASAAGFTGNELVMLHAVYAGGVNSTTNTGYIRSPWSGVIPLSPLNRSIPAFHWPCPGNVVITTGMVKNADKGRTWNRWWYPPYGKKLVVPPSPQGILCFTLYVSDLHMDLLHKAAKKMVFVNEWVYVKLPRIPGYIRLYWRVDTRVPQHF